MPEQRENDRDQSGFTLKPGESVSIFLSDGSSRCRDCHYWERETVKKSSLYSLWGFCNSEIFVYNSWGWHGNDIPSPIPANARFIYADHEGDDATFKVHEDFGCVGFKKKET